MATAASESLSLAAEPVDDTIRSVAKAFALLERISMIGTVSVGRLSAEADMPKPTVVRLMRTMMQCGYVRQATPRGDYCVTSKLSRLGASFAGLPAVLEAATARVDTLTEELLWPLSIATPEESDMVVRYSTMPISPYALARSTVGKRLSMWTSAHGRAWLAYHPLAEHLLEAAPAEERHWIGLELARTRERGHAIRSFGRDMSTGSIAVPILDKGIVVATLGLTHFLRAVRGDEIQRLAARLRAGAAEISRQLAAIRVSQEEAADKRVPASGTAPHPA